MAPDHHDEDKKLYFVILKFLNENNLTQTARVLERETGIFFNLEFFEELVKFCAFEEAEEYLSGFTTAHDNMLSTKIYFEVKKHRILDSLENGKKDLAYYILKNEIQTSFFKECKDGLGVEASQMLEIKDDMINEYFTRLIGDKANVRRSSMSEIKRCIMGNPKFHGKLYFPAIKSSLDCHVSKDSHDRDRDRDHDRSGSSSTSSFKIYL